ncbi:MAG: RNA methyltransferase [Holophagales bacterium]|nr:RNA methyltransferase [Holophagales bacterium]
MGQLRLISLLCNSRQSEEWKSKIPHQARLFTLVADELNSLLGFDFHRGVLCCCAAPEAPPEALLQQASRLLILPRIDNVDNLGQLIRTAAALGMDAIVTGQAPNPFARRCVRVSMGAVWKIPIFKRDNPEYLLDMWLQRTPNIKSEIVGTASGLNAESAWDWTPAPGTALVLGQESSGLGESWQARCARHIRIPLARQIDSLNVAAAGAIIMARLCSVIQPQGS